MGMCAYGLWWCGCMCYGGVDACALRIGSVHQPPTTNHRPLFCVPTGWLHCVAPSHQPPPTNRPPPSPFLRAHRSGCTALRQATTDVTVAPAVAPEAGSSDRPSSGGPFGSKPSGSKPALDASGSKSMLRPKAVAVTPARTWKDLPLATLPVEAVPSMVGPPGQVPRVTHSYYQHAWPPPHPPGSSGTNMHANQVTHTTSMHGPPPPIPQAVAAPTCMPLRSCILPACMAPPPPSPRQ